MLLKVIFERFNYPISKPIVAKWWASVSSVACQHRLTVTAPLRRHHLDAPRASDGQYRAITGVVSCHRRANPHHVPGRHRLASNRPVHICHSITFLCQQWKMTGPVQGDMEFYESTSTGICRCGTGIVPVKGHCRTNQLPP